MMIRLIILCSLALAFLLGCTLPSCLNPTIPPPAPITRAPSPTPTVFITPTATNVSPTETPTLTKTVSPTATNLPPTETATLTPTIPPTATQTRVVIKPGRDTLPLPTTGGDGPTWDIVILLAGGALLALGGMALWASKDNPTW